MSGWVHAFFSDQRVAIIFLLIVLDLALGLAASVAKGNFRLSFIADFLRNDVLGKVLPFFGLYGGFLYAKHTDIIIPGLDLEVIMNGAWVVVLAALVGSLLNSVRDLGLLGGVVDAIAGPDPGTPDPPATP